WMNLARLGVETRRVSPVDGRVDLNAVAAACDDKTRIITISWVGYASGWRNDVDALCELAHSRGALLFLDAIQGLGVFPLDVKRTPVDFLAADGHKWMLGPEGAGVLYIRRELLDRLIPLGVGWNSVVSSGDYTRVELDLKPSAQRYEGGSYNMVGLLGLGASVELLAQYGPEKISRRVIDITDHFCTRLEQLGAVVHSDRSEDRKSGIVAFETPGHSHVKLRERCMDEGIVLSVRAGRLRAALHAYNNEDDIERLAEVLKSHIKK
ncbi:MAG: aminotransferase class V-fold PLP-dependent enzyme, partial [Pirellulales bacterium]